MSPARTIPINNSALRCEAAAHKKWDLVVLRALLSAVLERRAYKAAEPQSSQARV